METRKRLHLAGVESFNFDARLMAASASGKSIADFLRDGRLYVADDKFENEMLAMTKRRIDGEPIAYITGKWEFYGLSFTITDDVLIPRDDTEVLVNTAIEYLKSLGPDSRVLDLCCGSGCVGLSIASTVRSAKIVMADISEKALAVARQNSLLNNLSRNVTCINADALNEPPRVIGQFDLIVCNPPYIPTKDIETLDVSVKNYEPKVALDGGEDGLDFYQAITKLWSPVLKPGGLLMYECGINQSRSISDILKSNGYGYIRKFKDTLGIDRVISGKLL